MVRDPYQTLGVSSEASDSEVRSAYRHLVLRHHPDHNGGSAESTRRFEEVQDAYAQIRGLRARGKTSTDGKAGASGTAGSGGKTGTSGNSDPSQAGTPPRPGATGASGPDVDLRMADLERQLREARAARERAAKAATEAAAQETNRHATDEELGYVKTDDSFTKIFDDAVSELSHWFSERRKT
jgi:molecular chaperone DnaJ